MKEWSKDEVAEIEAGIDGIDIQSVVDKRLAELKERGNVERNLDTTKTKLSQPTLRDLITDFRFTDFE